MLPEVKALIEHYHLQPLPVEGTLFSSTYRSARELSDGSPFGTAMIGLYCNEPLSLSRFHRLTADEIWHFYSGDPLRLVLLYPDGSSRDVILGSDPLRGQQVQFVIPAGVWQAGHVLAGGRYSLFGCTLAPGFTGGMFEGGSRAQLLANYPDRGEDIQRLGCDDRELRMPEGFIEPKTAPAYRWLLFDVDDTLFNFTLAESHSLEMTFRDLNLHFEPSYAEIYKQVNQAIWKEFEEGKLSSIQLRIERFARLFQRTNLTVDPEEFSKRYLINLGSCSDLIEGAEETVLALAGRYHLGLVTNGLSDVQRPRLAGSPFASLFEVLAISEEIGVAKPDGRFFDWVFSQIGNPSKSEVLVIGDSVSSDIQGAFNYGLDACRFNPRHLPPDLRFPVVKEIRDLRELIDWLR
jgi:YjjG family noncanonical pyrimidine nucleotidase